jgi:hypothetical protein
MMMNRERIICSTITAKYANINIYIYPNFDKIFQEISKICADM